MLTVLLGFAGFSVDLGNWYLEIQRLQRALDAAALDGVPYMPGQFDSQAREVAREGLLKNGVPLKIANAAAASTDCSHGKDCMRPVPGKPAELEVQAHVKVPSYFIYLLGAAHSYTFTRNAYSTFRAPLALGNVDNVLGGSEPVTGAPGWPNQWQAPTKAAGNANYFLTILGADSNKDLGDRYSTRTCLGDYDPTISDYCKGGINEEYTPSGYNYHVQVDPGSSDNYLRIEAYDPAFIYTDAKCSTSGGPGPACPGDDMVGYALNPPPSTTFTVTTSGAAPMTVNCNGGMNGVAFPGDSNPSGSPPATAPWKSWFHQWVPICDAVEIDPKVATDLTINVKTGAGDGMNSFLLRAGVMSTTNPTTMDQTWTYYHTRVSSYDRLGVFNNYGAGSVTSFHFVRVLPSWAGDTVSWQLFDLGDTFSGAGWINIVASPDVNTATNFNWSTCDYTAPGSLKSWQPTATGPGGGCEIAIDPDTFNGRVLNLAWHVPTTYNCDYSSPDGCWVMIDMNLPGGGDDHTTWSLGAQGSPIRLVKE